MKRFFDPCWPFRQGICLLAAGVLPEPEKNQALNHLAACPDCQKYYAEIKSVTAPLLNWEQNVSCLQPEPAVQARWAAAIRAAGKPERFRGQTPATAIRESERRAPPRQVHGPDTRPFSEVKVVHEPRVCAPKADRRVGPAGFMVPMRGRKAVEAFREWFQDVIWPYRRIWTGLATVWMLIFAGHISLREHSQIIVAKSSPRQQQMMIMAFKDRQTILAELLADHPVPRDADRQKSFLPKPRTEYTKILMT